MPPSSRFPWESQLDRDEGLSLPAWEGRHGEDFARRGPLRNPVPGFPVQLGLLVALCGSCLFSSHPLVDIPPKSTHSYSWCPNHHCPLPLFSPKSPVNSFLPAQWPSANSYNTVMPTKTESQLTFNQLPLDRLLSPGSQAGRQFVTHMAKTNRWGTKNHLGRASLSPWSNTSTAATAVTNRAWHFASKYDLQKRKGCGENWNRPPFPAQQLYLGKSYLVRQAQSMGQEMLGRDWSVPSLPTPRQGIAMPQSKNPYDKVTTLNSNWIIWMSRYQGAFRD